jgi:hypothetical protein
MPGREKEPSAALRALLVSESILAPASGFPSTSTTRPVRGGKSMVSSTKRGVNLGSGVIGGKPGVALGDKGSGCGGTVAEQADKKTKIKLR